jgi:hypothetical protein
MRIYRGSKRTEQKSLSCVFKNIKKKLKRKGDLQCHVTLAPDTCVFVIATIKLLFRPSNQKYLDGLWEALVSFFFFFSR